MNKEFNSEYYQPFPETMEKYQIPEDAFQYAGESLQSVEEMYFGFTMFLIF